MWSLFLSFCNMTHPLKSGIFAVSFLCMAFVQSDSPDIKLGEAKGKNKFELYMSIAEQFLATKPLKSVEYSRDAFNLAQQEGNDLKKARALRIMASGYNELRQYKLALEYYLKSLELSEIIGDASGIALATINIGKLYKELGDYDIAQDYYLKSLEIELRKRNEPVIAGINMELGTINFLNGNFNEALKFLVESLQMYTALNNKDKIWETYNLMGDIYDVLRNADSTLFYYQKAYNLGIKLKDLGKQSTSLNNIGSFYYDQQNFKKSLEAYNRALKIEIGQDDFLSEAKTFKAIGEIYMNLRKFSEALNYFTRAAELSTNIGAKKLLSEIYSDLSVFNRLQNNYQQAYEYYKLATELKDQITSEESLSQISEIESKLTMRNKDQQIQIIKQENNLQSLKIKTQRYIIFIITSLSILILALLFVIYSRFIVSRKAKRNLEDKNIKITDQKILLEKALAELKENAEIHESLIKNIQDGIFVIQDEKIRFANESFARIAGIPLESIYDMDYRKLIHPDDLVRIETYYTKRLAGEYVPSSYEFRIKNSKGETVHLSISVGIINYLGKQAHIGTVKDIHRQKRHEDDLIQQKERAELATRSKSFFLANMSHEIRNHMNSIIGITEVLEETQLDEDQKSFINVLKNSGNNLLNIINDILDFSKIEAGQIALEKDEFIVRDTIKNIVAMYDVKASQAGLYLNTVISPNVPERLFGDATRLGQILINLLSNAVKFTKEGGITIKVDHIPANYFEPAKNGVSCILKIEVIDTGLGINENSIQDLFKPFIQTHSAIQTKQKGTGLGLAICKQLTELMNGDIGVYSEVGKGSNFWFIVKLTNPDLSNISVENDKIIEGLNSRNSRILVVEDHMLNKYFLINVLSKAGYLAHTAENGKVGFDLYKVHHYDAVLMDIQMPVMDGIEATKLIREYEAKNHLKKTIIIAVTAFTKEGEQQRLFDAGMDYYLSKPFKSSELTGLLNELKLV